MREVHPQFVFTRAHKYNYVSVGDSRTFQAVLGSLQEGLRLVQKVLLWAVFDDMGKVMLKKEPGQ